MSDIVTIFGYTFDVLCIAYLSRAESTSLLESVPISGYDVIELLLMIPNESKASVPSRLDV